MDSKIFSLELFIDRIRLAAGEKCLFPSTILKLLNYEPALISCIENKIKENLKEYIEPIEKLGNIKQIEQLKDAEGNYTIRKGKSILFEADTISLINELSVLPIYVLITDDYYDPCHLVGVVAINLSSVITRLARKISNYNVTVSEDISGKFPILNLMGDGVGAIVLRLRLIYVGLNIGRHMAQEQEIEIRPKVDKLCERTGKSVGSQSSVKDKNDDNAHSQPAMIAVRNIGCQADEKRSLRIQVPPKSPMGNRVARIGLSIDPNDPLLEGPPPLIYNSHYGNANDRYEDNPSDYEDKNTVCHKDSSTTCPSPSHVSSLKKVNKDMPILNALFTELKAWKSEDFVEEIPCTKKSTVTNRSRSVEVRPPLVVNATEFLRRISTPKVRPTSPNGIVPKNLGWIRTEPQFVGPKKSSLEFKLTKTQLRRIELTNPRTYDRIHKQHPGPTRPITRKCEHSSKPKPGSIHSRGISNVSRTDDNAGGDNSATTYTELPPKQRHPLVPPLFNPGTSISVPSFTQTDSSSSPQYRRDNDINGRHQRLPPKLQNKQKNSNSQTMSGETNGTLEEADHFLNLNPVQSNRSPQMTLRSHSVIMNNDDGTEEYVEEDDGEDGEEEDEEDESGDNRRQYAYNNRSDEYSDEFNGSMSSSNGPISHSRRYSNASQISQTSEWRTEYSRGSSFSQNYLTRQESPPQSPNLGLYQSPPKSPVKSRKSLLATGVMPGGRFSDIDSSRQMRSSDSFGASFNEAAERSNYTTSDSMNFVTERDQADDETIRSFDQISGHPLRPASAGADVTSFTKVTKFDRSVAPGRQSNNYLGTNYLTSTVASMQTNDSQMLSSESFS